MFVEAWEVVVNSALLDKLKEGDELAKAFMIERLHGLNIYTHALSLDLDGVELVPFTDLVKLGVVSDITARGHNIITLHTKVIDRCPDYQVTEEDEQRSNGSLPPTPADLQRWIGERNLLKEGSH